MEALFHYIFLRVFCYSTESEEKVRESLVFAGYGNKNEDAEVEVQALEGSFGDEIKVMELKIKKARDMKNLWRNIIPFLDVDDADKSIDEECFFHMRLSKEGAFNGHIMPADDNNIISLKGKVKSFPSSRENAVSIIKDAISRYHKN